MVLQNFYIMKAFFVRHSSEYPTSDSDASTKPFAHYPDISEVPYEKSFQYVRNVAAFSCCAICLLLYAAFLELYIHNEMK